MKIWNLRRYFFVKSIRFQWGWDFYEFLICFSALDYHRRQVGYFKSLLSGKNAFSKEIPRFMPIIIGIKLGMTSCYGSGKGGWGSAALS
ncbi:MAG: hypothetical protein K9I94_06305, partial [Bacteroidales bacterium]|nr:hypothetical protein [Bacteroidales bacterium]